VQPPGGAARKPRAPSQSKSKKSGWPPWPAMRTRGRPWRC